MSNSYKKGQTAVSTGCVDSGGMPRKLLTSTCTTII